MLNLYSTLHISLCVTVIYFIFFCCARVKLMWNGVGGGKGTLSKGTKEMD